MLALTQLTLAAAACFSLTAALVLSGLYVPARRWLQRLPPGERVEWLSAWCAGPALLGPLLTLVCFLPSFVELAVPGIADHCLAHDDHHVHLCLLHPPVGSGDALGWAVLAGVAAAATAYVGRFASELRRSHRSLRALLAAAEPDAATGVHWVACRQPLALVVGLVKCRLVLASALRDALPPSLLEAVVLHEQAHARRRDVLRFVLTALVARLHLPSTRKALLRDLRLACEQAADADAAERLGDPFTVADAIVAVGRLAHDDAPELGLLARAFGTGDLRDRVDALLAPAAASSSSTGRGRMLVTAALLLMALGAGELHHVVETVLAPLGR